MTDQVYAKLLKISVSFKKARIKAGVKTDSLSRKSKIPLEKIRAFESGKKDILLSEYVRLCSAIYPERETSFIDSKMNLAVKVDKAHDLSNSIRLHTSVYGFGLRELRVLEVGDGFFAPNPLIPCGDMRVVRMFHSLRQTLKKEHPERDFEYARVIENDLKGIRVTRTK